MWKNNRTMNRTFLDFLCGGLLLIGIGVGIQLAEVSALSYGGEILVENTSRVESMVVSLSPHAEKIRLNSSDGRFSKQIREQYQVEVQESVDPGTAVVEFQYEGTPVGISYVSDTHQVPLLQSIDFFWFHENEVSTLMTYKDRILKDLKQGQLCDYRLWNLCKVVIRVNPADADRISVF